MIKFQAVTINIKVIKIECKGTQIISIFMKILEKNRLNRQK